MRSFSLLLAIVASAAVALLFWFVCDRPVPVEPSWNEPLRSVSFAPFRRGQSPLTKTYPTPAQVEEDLKSLVGFASGIRTYTSREGMDVVPDLAARYGLKVTFGAWLGTKKETNDLEVDALIKAANAHPGSIDRVLVGNEVLLRRDLKPDELISYIRKVKTQVRQPVSYADVWAFYLKYPEVGREVDFITIHILPFWEDEPVDIDHVEEHVVRIVDKIRAAFPGKPILIGEAGWPSLGRDRGPAVVNTVNEARFVRRMAEIAARHDFDYNIVEAFDQPWKAALENTVGASWGVFDIDRKAKFSMSGPVVEVADWPLRAAIAIGAGALLTLLFGRALQGGIRCFTLALLAQAVAWLAVTSAFHAEAVSFRWWQDVWAFLRGGLPVLLGIAIIARAAVFMADPKTILPAVPLAAAPDRWYGGALSLFSAAYAVVWTLLLFLDGRYRDIPVIDLSVPAFGLAALLLIRAALARPAGTTMAVALSFDGLFDKLLSARRSLWMASALSLSAVLALVSEGTAVIGEDFSKDHPTLSEQVPLVLKAMISNREMILWAVMLLIMAVPYWMNRRSRGQSA